ncbi:MAG: hypothetical protein WAN26_10260 [Steroidobacteraceae bacterium]
MLESVHAHPEGDRPFALFASVLADMHVGIDLDQESISETPQSLVEPRASTHREMRIPRKDIEPPGHLSD